MTGVQTGARPICRMSGEPTRLMETAASANQVGLPHRGERMQAKVPIGIAEARQLAGDRGTVNAAHRAHAGGADDFVDPRFYRENGRAACRESVFQSV